jgi:hypothetical protein
MAYKYFTQQLINKNILDLSTVFPDKQKIAQDRSQVSYNLGDVVVYLKDITDEFKITDNKYIDLDNAIREIVDKYYKSIGQEKTNPFRSGIDDEALKDLDKTSQTEAYIVQDGKSKAKGVGKSAPKKQEPENPKITEFKAQLEKYQGFLEDVFNEVEKKDFIEVAMQKKLIGYEIIAEDGDEEYITKVELLKDFINKNS